MPSSSPFLSVTYKGHKSVAFATHAAAVSGLDVQLLISVPVAVTARKRKTDSQKPINSIDTAVLMMLAEGFTAKAGAAALRVSIRSMRLHIQAIREKLGAATNEAMMARAFRLGLIK